MDKTVPTSILDQIISCLRGAGTYNSHELAPPTVILWSDEERLWDDCLVALQEKCPELWSLGDYDPDQHIGPAVWLRYQVEMHNGEHLPILYLPGIGRSAFRSAEQFPDFAKHLFALQFQGQFWTQKNGKDWTPFAFLSSSDGGLGLDVAADQKTKNAIQECLTSLLEVSVDELRNGRLEAADFRAKVTKDPARTLLQWMSDPEGLKTEIASDASKWSNFREVCREVYGFDPDSDGAITAVELLSSGSASWNLVWERFKEAPQLYPGVKQLLGTLLPKDLFEEPSEYRPLANKKEEDRLEADLLALSSAPPHEALARVRGFTAQHAHRAKWVWASLGDSPLAIAIGHLADAVELVESSGNHSTWASLATYYSTVGWKIDRSVLRALDVARPIAATKAVSTAIRAIYLPWLGRMAEMAQGIDDDYPNKGISTCRRFPPESGTVYLFADGLRMDMGRGLEERLMDAGLKVQFEHSWAALPTVTATAKPAWLPLAEKLGGPLEAGAFQAMEKSTGKPLTHDRFKKLMAEQGITYLAGDAYGSPTDCSWTEFGNFDTYGHEQGSKLAWRIEEELSGIEERIRSLISAGWRKVHIVTDHGWLMMPGGLPKIELPKHLTNSQWGRCANPDSGAQHGFRENCWFWDPADAVVLAPGISCFMAGLEYSHGGLTVQEALIPSLTVTAGTGSVGPLVVLKELAWSGLRLNMVFEGAEGFRVDIRGKVGDPSTSYVASSVTASAAGQRTSILVLDDDAIGTPAFLVVIDSDNQPIFKETVVIGEN